MKILRRLALGLIILAVAALVARMFLMRPIGEALFARAIDANLGVSLTESLEDGLHVFICGSGSPVPDPTRAGPCLAILAGERAFVFDTGAGGARKLVAMRFPVASVERIYLTHLHSDHIDGLGELMLPIWVGGSRSSPVPVSGPAGTIEVVSAFNAAFRIDSTFRIAHHGVAVANPAGYGAAPDEIVLPEDQTTAVVLNEGDLTITVIRVDHSPVEPAFGFRIDYKGRSVVVSGDTAYSDDLVAASKGADLLVHDALQPGMLKRMEETAAARGQNAIAKIFSDIPDYHASPEEAARAAEAAGVDALVLTHVVPPLPMRGLYPVFLGDAPKLFKGPIRVAEDGLIISLPAGGDAIRMKQTL